MSMTHRLQPADSLRVAALHRSLVVLGERRHQTRDGESDSLRYDAGDPVSLSDKTRTLDKKSRHTRFSSSMMVVILSPHSARGITLGCFL